MESFQSSTHIGLDLSQIQKEKIRPDTRIIIKDLHNPFHQFTIESHYIVLWSASLHFRKNLQFSSRNASKDQTTTNEVIITLDLSENSGITEQTVHIFFSLFYVPVFSLASLGSERYDFIEENILYLYQLSEHFMFQSLKLHCERQLFASFSLDHFKLLTEFSLISSTIEKHRMSIIDERINLYSRYLQWYQCCVEDAKYTPLPKEGGTTSSSRRNSGNRSNNTSICNNNNSRVGSNSGGGGEEEMEVEGPGFIYTEYFSCKKADILREWQCAIENIDSCHIPSRSISKSRNGNLSTINYYRKLCIHCIKADASPTREYYIDLGSMTKISGDDSDVYSFRLKKLESETEYSLEIGLDHKNSETSTQQAKRMKLLADYYRKKNDDNEQNNEMIIDHHNNNNIHDNPNGGDLGDDKMQTSSSSSGEEQEDNTLATREYIYDCRSSITLLSKQLNLPSFSFHYPEKHIGFVGEEIGKFSLNEKNDCYIGRCDRCKEGETEVYIIILKILLERLKLFRPPKCKIVNK